MTSFVGSDDGLPCTNSQYFYTSVGLHLQSVSIVAEKNIFWDDLAIVTINPHSPCNPLISLS